MEKVNCQAESFFLAQPLEKDVICSTMAKRKNPMAVALGRRGGKKSAAGRMKKISPARRSEIARNAVKARWAKWKKDHAD